MILTAWGCDYPQAEQRQRRLWAGKKPGKRRLLGPAAGRLAADLVAGDAPIIDPHPLRFTRFAEGEQGPPAAM